MVKAEPKVYFDVTHSYGGFMALEHIKFNIYENELLCIVGPSGSGKTTIANIMAGLLEPTNGFARLGKDSVDPRKHNISYVFQARSCLPWRTVKENVRIVLEIKGITGPEADKRIADVLQIVGLTGFENYYPNQISGGMKQRVAIARAFCVGSDLLVLDEPFGSLDAQTRYLMQGEVLKVWEKMKRTVIFFTNNIEEAVFLADRLLVLSSSPAKIIKEIDVNLLRPRSLTDPEFLDLRKTVSNLSELSQDV